MVTFWHTTKVSTLYKNSAVLGQDLPDNSSHWRHRRSTGSLQLETTEQYTFIKQIRQGQLQCTFVPGNETNVLTEVRVVRFFHRVTDEELYIVLRYISKEMHRFFDSAHLRPLCVKNANDMIKIPMVPRWSCL